MSRIILLCLLLPALCQAADTDELETVVVTASPIGDPDALATIAGTADRAALLRSGGASLADALDWVAGVTGSGAAPGASRPVIRGFDSNRVRTLEDGVGSFDVADVGADHGVPLDPLAAERVEVVRGAATLRYGSQAIGGVVNAITNRVPNRRADGVQSEFSAGYGTVADGGDASGQVNLAAGAFGLHADAFVRRADDYATPAGTLANSWVHNEGGAVGGTWFAGEDDADRVGLAVVRYGSRYGLPGEESHIDMRQTKLMLRSAFDLAEGGAEKLTVDGGWADYVHDELDADGATLATFLDREWDMRAELLFGKSGPFSELAAGAQLQDRDFSALGEGADYLAPTRTRSAAVFGFSEAPLGGGFKLQVGARVETVGVDGTPAGGDPLQRTFTPISASMGLVYGDGPWRLGLALASAARAPAQTELYARGAHEGSSTYELGDASLDVERANSAELSLRWRQGRVHADGSIWMADFNGFIHGALTGRTCDASGLCIDGDGLDLREMRYMQRDARYAGGEGHADVELAHTSAGRLELNLLADIVRAEFTGNGGDVPRIPPWHAGAGLSWESESFDVNVRAKYAAAQGRIGEGDTPTDAYTNLDAQLAWRPWGDGRRVEFALIGSNLTDSLQRNAVALNKDEVPLPGRDLRLLVRGEF